MLHGGAGVFLTTLSRIEVQAGGPQWHFVKGVVRTLEIAAFLSEVRRDRRRNVAPAGCGQGMIAGRRDRRKSGGPALYLFTWLPVDFLLLDKRTVCQIARGTGDRFHIVAAGLCGRVAMFGLLIFCCRLSFLSF